MSIFKTNIPMCLRQFVHLGIASAVDSVFIIIRVVIYFVIVFQERVYSHW